MFWIFFSERWQSTLFQTVTEIRRSGARDTLSRECLPCTEFSVKLEANGEIETEWCGQIYGFIFQNDASSTVLNALKATDRGSRKTRRERIAVAKA